MRHTKLLTAVSLVVGCSSSPRGSVPVERDGGLDFAPPYVADLLTPSDLSLPRDLALPPAPGCGAPGGKGTYRYVVRSLRLPAQRVDHAWDLNGDGRVDNHYGNIVGALAGQTVDAQGAANQAVATGATIELLSLLCADPRLEADASAVVTAQAGLPRANPDYRGNGTFTVDQGFAPGLFCGALSQSSFASEDPATTKRPVKLVIRLPLLGLTPGSPPPPLTLSGARLAFTTVRGGPNMPPTLIKGQVNGSISVREIHDVVVPAVAGVLEARVRADPNSGAAKQILILFDTGGCGAARANDGRIDPCEVEQNPIFNNLLGPDVEIYNAKGEYAPNPANTTPNAMSIGFAFEAVQAKF